MVWYTNIVDESIERIIALSDIHSDIHALIIELRDCAKVIKKKNMEISKDNLDKDTEYLLNLDLNENEELYKDDLNYEWCGGKHTHIVICGDILDGYRPPQNNNVIITPKKECNMDIKNGCNENEYYQIEIKLLRFINALNKQAILQSKSIDGYNRIHKILGNHDVMNLRVDDIPTLQTYIFPATLNLKNYYNNFNRIDYFKHDNQGSTLYTEDGCGIFLKINNNLFVHGQLDHNKSYNEYLRYNNLINEKIYNIKNMYFSNSNTDSILWGRQYDRDSVSSTIINEDEKYWKHVAKCQSVKNNLKKFITQISDNKYELNDMRVIVGHCPQHYYTVYKEEQNSSFTNIQIDGVREILTGNIRTGISDGDGLIFGIGMECDKKSLDQNPEANEINDSRFIYKVDSGVSRGFDRFYTVDNTSLDPDPVNEKSSILARTPQILEFNKNNGISIIRSTIRNTRIHQPRQHYEKMINDDEIRFKGQKIIIDQIVKKPSEEKMKSNRSVQNASYYQKYLKYKNKYLNLKKNR